MVDHDDPGLDRGVSRSLQIATAWRALTATLIAGLVVRRYPRPELAFTAHEIELRAVAGFGRRAPHERLAEEPRFLPRRCGAAKDLPAPGAEIVRAALENRDGHVRAERRLQRRKILARQLVLQGQRVGRDHDALAAAR